MQTPREILKTKQTYARFNCQDAVYSLPLIAGKWYPVTEHYGMCGRIIDKNGEAYLLDIGAVVISPLWQVKVVEVSL